MREAECKMNVGKFSLVKFWRVTHHLKRPLDLAAVNEEVDYTLVVLN